jgi:hypothetical protein
MSNFSNLLVIRVEAEAFGTGAASRFGSDSNKMNRYLRFWLRNTA